MVVSGVHRPIFAVYPCSFRSVDALSGVVYIDNDSRDIIYCGWFQCFEDLQLWTYAWTEHVEWCCGCCAGVMNAEGCPYLQYIAGSIMT
jgi:hypothetical protein